MRLEGKTALVTGAGRNIGRKIALRLAEEGADVAVNVRSNIDEGEAVAHEIRQLGRRSLVLAADVADGQAVESMAAVALAELGRIDVLVSNVGIRPHIPFLELTIEEWARVRSVNLDGAVHCARAVLPSMVENKFGRVVFLVGDGAWNVGPNRAHLAASKLGLVGLCRGLASEMAVHNIRLNIVSPGRTSTKRDRPDVSADRAEIEEIPMGRLGTADEIASACLFLVTDDSAYVTGQTLHVNGGAAYF